MRYYMVSDVHGFYTPLQTALREAGYFEDQQPHKLVILGDLFDRGKEAVEMQRFILDLLEKDAVILIRGNHEDLFEELVTADAGAAYSHHLSNGTFDTALQLTGYDPVMARIRNYDFAEKARQTPYYQTILPAMRDCFETEHHIFVHGWIPCLRERGQYCCCGNWREAAPVEWAEARWVNGMEAASQGVTEPGKTIVCGHRHTSYGHSRFEKRGGEFTPDADFSPYYGQGIIAMDGCTAWSGVMNCVVVEDEEVIA